MKPGETSGPGSCTVVAPSVPSTSGPGAAAGNGSLAAEGLSQTGHRYQRKGRLGEGGMGVVVEAVDPTIQRTVAMKVMTRQEGETEGQYLRRFLQEARITGQLEHPNIVPVHELGTQADGTPYYTMKLIQGRTLKDIVVSLRAGEQETIAHYPLSRLLTIFLKVCDAMAFAHSRGVVHRDLKPENIMVGEYGEVQIVDWGVAKVLGAEPPPAEGREGRRGDETQGTPAGTPAPAGEHRTLAGTVIGTPAFMSPEQARGDVAGTGPQSDIYSLGAILYNLLTLHLAIEEEDPDVALGQVLKGQFLPPAERVPAGTVLPHLGESGGRIPPALSAVALRAMAYRPAGRYPTVQALQQDVEAYQAGFATSAERPSLVRRAFLFAKRHKKEVFLGALALVLLGVVSGIFAVRMAVKNRELRQVRVQPGLSRLVWTGELDRMRAKSCADFLTTARRLMARERWQDALEAARIGVEVDPANAEAVLLKGRLLLLTGRYPEAETTFRRGLEVEGVSAGQASILARYVDWATRCTGEGQAGQEARAAVAREMKESGDTLLALRLEQDTTGANQETPERVKDSGGDRRQRK